MRLARTFSRWAVGAGLLGCTETRFRFFDDDAPRTPCDVEGCAGGDGNGSGDETSATGGSRTTPEPSETCESASAPDVSLVRLQLTNSENCVSVGAFTELVSDPAYETALASCAATAAFWFSMRGDDTSREIRSEATDYNVDVRFAASQAGTRVVLYAPHALYNQRFRVSPVAGESFRLSPLHAPTQCLSERSGTLEIWPCDESDVSQTFRKLSCR